MDWKKNWNSFLNEYSDVYPFPSGTSRAEFAIATYAGLTETHRSHADTISKQVAGDIIKYLKSEFDMDDDPVSFFEEYYIPGVEKTVNVEFTMEVSKTGTGAPFSIDSGVYPEAPEPLIEIKMVFDARYPITSSIQEIYFKLLEDVRHELEHLIGQNGGEPAKSVADHYIDKGEIPSLVRGLHLRAKKMKIPTEEMFQRELDQYVQANEISSEESKHIFQIWKQELDKIQGKGK